MNIGLPLSITDARKIRTQLMEELNTNPSNPALERVRFETQRGYDISYAMQDKLSINLHGWHIEYHREQEVEDYESRYYHKNAIAVFKDSTLTFCCSTPWTGTHWKGVSYGWTSLAHQFSSVETQKEYVHTSEGTISITGGVVEYLWREGYQFEDYLPGSFEPDPYAKRTGPLIIRYIERKNNEGAVLDQLRMWYLARLARQNLHDIYEADKVLHRRCVQRHRQEPEFAMFLGTFCRNVIDNLLLLEPKVEQVVRECENKLEKVALEWTPLLAGIETE